MVLGVRDVVKVFGQTVALDGVSMNVRHGESMALLGANGAGKSSLVKILSGAVVPDEGEVVIDGQVVVLKGVHDARPRGIGFVPQELTVAPDLTVAENVLAAGWPRRKGLVERRDGAGPLWRPALGSAWPSTPTSWSATSDQPKGGCS